MATRPQWLMLGEQLLGPTLAAAKTIFDGPRTMGDFDSWQIPVLAVFHLASALDCSMDANEKGRHAVAISLARHCVEALTIVDVGLQADAFAVPLLEKWRDDKKTSGELRQELERTIWSAYGSGLWNEPWAEYFGSLARAVQPYAHVSRGLLEWQLAVAKPYLKGTKFTVAIGQYDALKASRITLLHVLVVWTLGRLLVANKNAALATTMGADIDRLGRELGTSKLLFGKRDWGLELLPNMFFKHGTDWRDA